MNFQDQNRYCPYGTFLYRLSDVNQNVKLPQQEQNRCKLRKNRFGKDDFISNGDFKGSEHDISACSTLSESRSTPPQCKLRSNYLNNIVSKYSIRHGNSSTTKGIKENQPGTNMKHTCDMEAKFVLLDGFEGHSEDISRGCYGNLYSDKTTYCRPVVNIHNQEFLNKTIKENVRLQRLVKQLVIDRQNEKEIEDWKNYINQLKRKHCLTNDPKIRRPSSLQHINEEIATPDYTEDYFNTKCMCKNYNPSQNIDKNISKEYHTKSSGSDHYLPPNVNTFNKQNIFQANSLCYPISSQGRLIMLERERMKRLPKYGYKRFHKKKNEDSKLGDNNSAGKIKKTNNWKTNASEKSFVVFNSRGTNTTLQSSSVQTEFQPMYSENIGPQIKNTSSPRHSAAMKVNAHVQHNTDDIKESTEDNLKRNSLANIEEKLDSLINSINTFVLEMKTKKNSSHKYFDQSTKLGKGNVGNSRSDSFNIARNQNIICGFIDSGSGITQKSSDDKFLNIDPTDKKISTSNDVLLIGLGNKAESVRETYRSVKISVTIPTREISTEVTRSLSKAHHACDSGDTVVIEEIPRQEDKRIAIAVNTDPVSLLAMLRVSTEETIRRLLSYVPSIDYYSYLARLGPLPRAVESQYVCNLCGAAFTKPSALTDHIQKHDLGKTRDCCICRNVLDRARRPWLFKCQYCGQRFARAYCCDLHQQSCARRLGRSHDVSPSLALLR